MATAFQSDAFQNNAFQIDSGATGTFFAADASTVVLQRKILVQTGFDVVQSPFVAPRGWMGQSPVLFTKPYPAAQQQFSEFFPTTPPAEVVIDYWIWSQSPDLFWKPFLVSQQQFASFAPAGTIVSYTPQGWYGQFPDLFRKAGQLGGEFSAPTFSRPPSVFSSFGEPVRQKRDTSSSEFNAPQAKASPYQAWAQAPDVFRRPSSAASSEFNVSQVITPPVVITYQAWAQGPDVFRRPYSAAQQFQEFAPLGGASPSQGWMGQYPDVFRKSPSVAQSVAFTRGRVPTPETSQGWMFQSPDVRVKPMNRVLMLFSEYSPIVVPDVTITPTGRFPYSYISSSYIQ
jgi:hypothetical protein